MSELMRKENPKINPAEQDKLFLKALRSERSGEKTQQVPFWFMRQAGRYLEEYRALRASRNGFLDMAYDPASAIEITMQPIRRFEMDAAIIFSDILVVPHALGQSLEFAAGEGPLLNPVQDTSSHSFENFHDVLTPVYEAIAGTRKQLMQEGFEKTALIGFAGAPWTVACYMIQGHGKCDFKAAKELMKNQPENFKAIIDLLIDATSQYLIRQIEAGAEAVQIFDSWSGLLEGDEFHDWSITSTKAIVQNLRKVFPDVPVIGFPRGASPENYKRYAQQTGVNALGLDQSIDTRWAAENLQPICCVQGNLDPDILKSGEALEKTAQQILQDLSAGPFVFNLGHGIDKDTPVSHVERLVKVIKDFRA